MKSRGLGGKASDVEEMSNSTLQAVQHSVGRDFHAPGS